MYESDKVVGEFYCEAVRVIEALDLWHEVTGLETDCYSIVTKVNH